MNKLVAIIRAIRVSACSESVLMSENPAYAAFKIGKWTYGFPKIYHWNEGCNLTIGNYCSFANNTAIFLGGNHRTDWVTTHPISNLMPGLTPIQGHPTSKGNVVIGHDVWVGNGAVILSGVKVGNGSVIGACAVVSRDIPPYAVAVGNPARVVKYRFNTSQIEKLMTIEWWLWPDDKVKSAVSMLQSNRIDEFIEWCVRLKLT
jgi:acetyltransferase-like isoleucine patch superfamily enzyme